MIIIFVPFSCGHVAAHLPVNVHNASKYQGGLVKIVANVRRTVQRAIYCESRRDNFPERCVVFIFGENLITQMF